jgi:very-short-patch-repair endonuclease
MRERWPAVVDVTTLRAARPRPGIRVHSSLKLTLDDRTFHRGLPITTPTRTLIDATPGLDDRELRRACSEAQFLGHLDRGLPSTGPVRLQRALAKLTATGPQRTKTELENTFLAIVDRYDLPPPLVNAPVLTYTVDFLWPAAKLIVETDGRNHLRPHVYEADRERDAILQLHGYRVVRFTTTQLEEQPAQVARVVRQLASTTGWTPSRTSRSPSSAAPPNATTSSMP